MTEVPVLYTFRRCPYAMRARLALAISGLPCELREITLRHKPAQMLAASPKSTVPVLVLPDGTVIDESLTIMQWALQQHDPDHWLHTHEQTQLDSLALITHNDGPFKNHLDRYKYPNRYRDCEPLASTEAPTAFAHRHRTAGALWLAKLESTLQSAVGTEWLYGSQCSLADMAVLPFVRQFAHTDAGWFAVQPWPALVAWLARFEGSALYAEVMQKHAPWQAPEFATN
jgi:glutathione S-transferase